MQEPLEGSSVNCCFIYLFFYYCFIYFVLQHFANDMLRSNAWLTVRFSIYSGCESLTFWLAEKLGLWRCISVNLSYFILYFLPLYFPYDVVTLAVSCINKRDARSWCCVCVCLLRSVTKYLIFVSVWLE